MAGGGGNKTQFTAYKLHKWVAANFKNAGGKPTIDYHPIRERGGGGRVKIFLVASCH